MVRSLEVFPSVSRPGHPSTVAEFLPNVPVEVLIETTEFLRDELESHQIVPVEVESNRQ